MINHPFDKNYFEVGTKFSDRGYDFKGLKDYYSIIAEILKLIVNPTRVLDIGCAKGFLVFSFSSIKIDAHGVDISSYAISEADLALKEKVKVCDICSDRLPFNDNYFDLIVIMEVLGHPSSFDNIIKGISRVLTKNGYIFATTPKKGGIYEKADPTHINVKDRDFWRKFFASAGYLEEKLMLTRFKKLFSKPFRRYIFDKPPTSTTAKFMLKLGKPGKILRSYLASLIYFRNSELFFKKSS